MLLETIQEAVDQVYFLEEDTIQIAGSLMDSVLRQELLPLVCECIEEQRQMDERCNLSSSECDEGFCDQESEDMDEHSLSHSARHLIKPNTLSRSQKEGLSMYNSSSSVNSCFSKSLR